MKKLSKREKIVLIAAFLAAVYMGATFLFSQSGRSLTPSDSEDLDQSIVLEIAKSLAEHQLTKTEQAVLEKARTPWPSQPFVLTEVSPAEVGTPAAAEGSEAASGSIRYTGCLEIGTKRLAIINGKEYEPGDRIEESPYVVSSISFEQVMLQDADNRTVVISMEDIAAAEAAPDTQPEK